MHSPCGSGTLSPEEVESPRPREYDIAREEVLLNIKEYLENLMGSVEIVDMAITGNNSVVVASENYWPVHIVKIIFDKFSILPNSIFYEDGKVYVGYLWFSWC